mmetsp:Transcript_15224/g.23911  ORF Transcript_15224/g.23911 Transcript_15224/m.23911 type:complete len:236 (+) Transcript_15224:73-780(+)
MRIHCALIVVRISKVLILILHRIRRIRTKQSRVIRQRDTILGLRPHAMIHKHRSYPALLCLLHLWPRRIIFVPRAKIQEGLSWLNQITVRKLPKVHILSIRQLTRHIHRFPESLTPLIADIILSRLVHCDTNAIRIHPNPIQQLSRKRLRTAITHRRCIIRQHSSQRRSDSDILGIIHHFDMQIRISVISLRRVIGWLSSPIQVRRHLIIVIGQQYVGLHGIDPSHPFLDDIASA